MFGTHQIQSHTAGLLLLVTYLTAILASYAVAQDLGRAPLPLPDDADRSRPFARNVLLIISDDLKPVLSSYGVPYMNTPNIDRLAARGVRFTRAYTQWANCGPSRASFLTSIRPEVTKVFDNQTPLRNNRKDALTLMQIFRAHGYHVHGMGKIGDGRVFGQDEDYGNLDAPSYSEPLDFNQNSTHCYQMPKPTCNNKLGWKQDECKCLVSPAVSRGDIGTPAIQRSVGVPLQDFIDERMGDHAANVLTRLLSDSDTTPFLLIVGLTKPHLPFVAPSSYFDHYDAVNVPLAGWRAQPRGPTSAYGSVNYNEVSGSYVGVGTSSTQDEYRLIRAYAACVSFVDTQVGKMLKALDESTSPKRDDTLVVFTSDHGFHLGDHGLWGKHTVMEHGTRVPLIIVPPYYRSPGTFSSEWSGPKHAGRVVRTPVQLLDILPTLMDLTGLFETKAGSSSRGRRRLVAQPGVNERLRKTALAQVQGKSLRDLLIKGDNSETSRAAISMYIRGGARGYAIRTERYRYIQWFAQSQTDLTKGYLAHELYDYAVDPLESQNIVSSQSNVQKDMKRLFSAYINSDRNVEYLRSNFPQATSSDEDKDMLNLTLPLDVPEELGHLKEWKSVPSAECPQSGCASVVHSFVLPNSPFSEHHVAAVVTALKLTIRQLITEAGLTAEMGSLTLLPSASSEEDVYTYSVRLVTQDQASALAASLKHDSDYFNFMLNENLDGVASDEGLQKTGLVTSSLNDPVVYPPDPTATDSPTAPAPTEPTAEPTEPPTTEPTEPTIPEPVPTHGPTSAGSRAPTPPPSKHTTSPTTKTTTAPRSDTNDSSSLSAGAIVGIVLGTLAFTLAVAAMLGWFFMYRRRQEGKPHANSGSSTPEEQEGEDVHAVLT